ncbi:MAG: ComF family protein [Anaerococcus sp.]|nr:ComF family protein [Anaerococcus sp.]
MIDFLFLDKDLCYGCKKNKAIKYKLCDQCLDKFDYVANEFMVGDNPCYSIYFYNDFMKTLIGSYKFQRNTSLYEVFAKMFIDFIRDKNLVDFDYILGSPSSIKTYNKRGFDHIGIIVEELGKELGIEVLKDFKKVKNTKSQHLLDRFSRSKNLRGAFRINKDLKASRILLIDDLITTGNTVKEIIKVLKEAGAKEVISIALASERSI